MRLKGLTHTIGLGLAMLTLWLLLSGQYNVLLFSMGIASCILIVAIAHRLDVIDHEAVPLHLSFGYFAYLAWLGKEITKSNWDVAKLVIAPKLPISPTMVWVPAGQKTDVGKVIYANSITLTPGTVSVELEQGQILVHAITRDAADALETGDMNRRVCAIEER